MKRELNFRDIADIANSAATAGVGQQELVPRGMFLRSGKLGILSRAECARLCRRYAIRCVIDLRTPIEAAEYPDPLPPDVEYVQIPLLQDATVGITRQTGSDPMTIIRRLRRDPARLREMVPDFGELYREIVTDPYSRAQTDRVVDHLRENARRGICTLYHCTAGKDRTGIVSMALLKSYGIPDELIVRDYLATNRSAFWPTVRKCLAIWFLTWNTDLVRTAYTSFMAQRKHIETAIKYF